MFLGICHLLLGSDKNVGSDKNIRKSDHRALFAALLNYYLMWSLCLLLYLLPCVILLLTSLLDYYLVWSLCLLLHFAWLLCLWCKISTDQVFWMYLQWYKNRLEKNKAASASALAGVMILSVFLFQFSLPRLRPCWLTKPVTD